MPLIDLIDWMDEHARPEFVWYLKRLAANDTLATGAHQAGPYLPKDLAFDLFPSLNQPTTENPRCEVELHIDSHADVKRPHVIWYNNRVTGDGTRNETRMTRLGGSTSALLDPDNTGCLAVFAFRKVSGGDCEVCSAWVCDQGPDADVVEDRVGPVEPGKGRVWTAGGQVGDLFSGEPLLSSCWLRDGEIPEAWLTSFPSGLEIVQKALQKQPCNQRPPDVRLIKRRECEFEVFRSVEQAVEMPVIRRGFETIEAYLSHANSIIQRRKSRSGRSLELHVKQILEEEGLRANCHYSAQVETENGKRPDFVFPSLAAYRDAAFPAGQLRMLAVKTTCKDRWRQVMDEADRIPVKHLLTLQEGVSEGQFRQMYEAGVRLVIPESLRKKYPTPIREHLQSLESFIGDVRLLSSDDADVQ